MSTRRSLKYKDLGEWLPGHCIYCRGPLPPNCHRTRRWCSEDCVHQYKLRSHSGYLRDHTHQRDHGVCVLCGLDTDFMSRVVHRLRQLYQEERRALRDQAFDHALQEVWPDPEDRARVHKLFNGDRSPRGQLDPALDRAFRALHGTLTARLLDADLKSRGGDQDVNVFSAAIGVSFTDSLWQADHTLPVCEGGGASKEADPMANIRTLCSQCHLVVTADLTARRKAARKAAKPPKAPHGTVATPSPSRGL